MDVRLAEANSSDAGENLLAASRALIAALHHHPNAAVAPELREQLVSFVNSLLAATPLRPEDLNGANPQLPI